MIWKNLLSSDTGLPVVVRTVQKIMDARHHPDHISIHEEFELVFVQEIGKGTFYIDDKTINVKANDLILIKPNIPHYLKVESNQPGRFVVLKFSFGKTEINKMSNISANDFLSFISDSNDNGGFFKLSNANCTNISSIMQQILHETKSPDGESEFLKSLLTVELFVWLSRSLRLQWESNLANKGDKMQAILESAKLFIEENYNTDITLSDISGYVYISTSHFSRAFKKEYKTSPIQYLLSYRIEKAKTLLEETNQKVGDIAFSVGFSAQQRFNDIFKKHLGLSPGEYRQQYRDLMLNIE